MFDTKIAFVLRDDLAPWQALNVTAFLATGIAAENPEIMGAPYIDRLGNKFNALSVQPMIVLSADQETLRKIQIRGLDRAVPMSAYIEEMFATSHDAANREVFGKFEPADALLVGLALRADKKLVDKITKGATMHT